MNLQSIGFAVSTGSSRDWSAANDNLDGNGSDRLAPDTLVPEFTPGSWLNGTYRIERCLAHGGMGQIFSATHARLPGLFAIKVLQPCFSDDEELVTRFRREAEIMATLRHPHVVQVMDYDVSPQGRPYLVMEHLEGVDLAEILRRRGRLSSRSTADLVQQMASALAAAHAQGVVHLDLKPENVMVLGGEGNAPFVKVIDFGISKSGASIPVDGGTLIGTPEYMSPEQIEGNLDGIDGRADQFSLAVMAYVLLTGHSPWGMDEPYTVLYRIVHEAPQCLGNYLAVALPHVEAVLRRAMAKSPAARYASITEFARSLVEAVKQDAVAGEELAVENLFAPMSAPLAAVASADGACRDAASDLAHGATLRSVAPLFAGEERAATSAITRASRGLNGSEPTPAWSAWTPAASRENKPRPAHGRRAGADGAVSSGRGRWAICAAAVAVGLGAWFGVSSRVMSTTRSEAEAAVASLPGDAP